MPIPVQCASCKVKLNAPDAAAGRRVKCPKCGQPLAIPALAAPPPEPEPVDLAPARPVARPVEADDRPVPPKKKAARRRDGDDLPTPERDRPAPAKQRVHPAILVVSILCGLFGVAGVVGVVIAHTNDAGPQLAANPKGRPNPPPGGFNPGPFNPGGNKPDVPFQPGPLTATDLTPTGLHATIDVPPGTTFGTGYMARIQLSGGTGLNISSEEKDEKNSYFEDQLAKAAVVEKTTTAVWAEEKSGFGGRSSHLMRSVLPVGDRKLVLTHTVYGTRADAEAIWGLVKTFRQTEAQQKAEKPRQAALDKFKAAEQSFYVGGNGVSVTLDKPTAEMLAALKDIPDLTRVSLYSFGELPSPENAKILPQLPNLQAVTVAGTDEELVAVGQCAGLTELTLATPRATDAGLAPLGNLTNLTTLNLSRGRFTGSGLAVVQKLRKLQKLNLSSVPLADDALRHVSGLPELTELYLSHSTVTDAGVRHLTGLAKLTTLDLEATPVTGATLGALADSPKITDLDLSESAVTDAGLSQAGRLTVRTVNLRNTRVGNTGAAAVAKWGGLNYLHLDGTGVTDDGMAALAGAKLQSLSLSHTAVTEKGVLALADAPELSSLNLDECNVTDAVVAAAVRNPKLSSLNLLATAVTDASLAPLARLGKDRYLSVYVAQTQVTPTAAKAATKNSVSVYASDPPEKTPVPKGATADPPVPLAKLKPADPEKLFQALDIEPDRDEDAPGKPIVGLRLARDDKPLSDAELAEIRDLKSLRLLSISSANVTDGGLAYLAGLTGLEELSLYSCNGVTGSGFVHLQKLPKLKRLTLPYPKSGTKTTAATLRPLADIKTLEEVEVPTPESVKVLFELYGQLPNLKRVQVNGSVRATDIKALPPLPSVVEFRLATYGGESFRAWATGGFAGLKAARVVELGIGIDDGTAAHLAKATAIRELAVSGKLLTVEGYKSLAGLPELTALTLKNGHLGTAELAALAAAPKLESLTLSNGTFPDPTLSGLAGAKGLTEVRISGVLVTDAALPALAKLPALEVLELNGTAVTKAAVDKLRAMKPDLDIQYIPAR